MTKPTYSQRGTLCVTGILIAVGLCLGLALVRALVGEGGVPTLEAIVADVIAESATYAYLASTTLSVGVTLGWLIGGKAEKLERMGHTDSLTQLANRRGFMTVLHDELRRAARYHTPLAMLLLDIDFFKDVNDARGHDAGDAALKLVADSLRGTCRGTDLPARFGGDEFVVVAPSTTAAEAFELANRIRQKLGLLAAERPELGHLSLSIGIADLQCAGSCQGEALIGAADAALYRAKNNGRDCACVAHRCVQQASGSRPVAVA